MRPLITDAERVALLANDQGADPVPVVRLFTPDAHATWLLASLDPADGDTDPGSAYADADTDTDANAAPYTDQNSPSGRTADRVAGREVLGQCLDGGRTFLRLRPWPMPAVANHPRSQ